MSVLTYQHRSTGNIIKVRKVIEGNYVFESEGQKVRLTKYALRKNYTFLPEKSKYRKMPSMPSRGV